MTSSCDQCRRFRSDRGLLIRSFECRSDWDALPTTACEKASDKAETPLSHAWLSDESNRIWFYPPTYGARLLARTAANASDDKVRLFRRCAKNEISPAIGRSSRPTSLLREGYVNWEYATYANAFGLTLRGSTKTLGAHAFDAWTRGKRPNCGNNESIQAELRLDAVNRLCESVKNSAHYQWPGIHLDRLVASTHANCRFKTVPSMLKQQAIYQKRLREDSPELLARCPHVLSAGGINQVAADYNASDVTGIYVLDWIPSHLPLATLAFQSLPPWASNAKNTSRKSHLTLVRFSKGSGSANNITCACHELPAKPPWPVGLRALWEFSAEHIECAVVKKKGYIKESRRSSSFN